MSKAIFWCLPLLWLLVIFTGFLVYGASGHDDAHINFWFAHTLLERGEMVNYNGDRVDQATNLLLVFVTALLTKLLPFDLVTCGYLVDVFACFACCGLLTGLARKICPAVAVWPALIVLSCVSFLVWTFGGMGGVLASLCLLAGVAVWWQFIESPQLKAAHYVALVSVALALVFVRPEMSLLIPIISLYAVVFYWHDDEKRKRCLQILAINVLCGLLLFLGQKIYFSSWLPLPVIAKQSGDFASRVGPGSFYVFAYSVVNPVVGVAFLLSISVLMRLLWKKIYRKEESDAQKNSRNGLWVLLIGVLQVYMGFVWIAGGDWMHAGRFMVPVIPLAALLVTSVLLALVRKPYIAHLLLASLLVFGFNLHSLLFIDGASGVPAWIRYRMLPQHESYSLFEQYNYEHLRDMVVIDHLREIIPELHEKLGRPVRLISGQAGMVFYKLAEDFPGMVQFTDLRGLVEDSLTLCPFLVDKPRDVYGLAWDGYAEYFKMLPALQENCGIQPPDIVFDLDGVFQDYPNVFEDAGYVLVHQQRGSLVQDDAVLPSGKSAVLLNVIFVRRELLPFLQDQNKRIIDHSSMPLHERWGYDWFHRIL